MVEHNQRSTSFRYSNAESELKFTTQKILVNLLDHQKSDIISLIFTSLKDFGLLKNAFYKHFLVCIILISTIKRCWYYQSLIEVSENTSCFQLTMYVLLVWTSLMHYFWNCSGELNFLMNNDCIIPSNYEIF